MTPAFRSAIADLIPYEPGKPAEELMRERGLDRVVKLASNEGPWGPVPAARAAIEAGINELNRYPDGAAVMLRQALADRHGIDPSQVMVGHGADSIINNLSLAMLEPGDEVVCGWPSFPSYVLDATMMGATPRMVALDVNSRYDLGAMLEAVTPRTKIVYVCNPNNPTGTMVGRGALERFLDALPEHVLPVLDEAYFEYVTDRDYPDGIEDFFKQGRSVVVLRTFSKIFGLAGLRVGYAVADPKIGLAVNKVRNAFDVTSLAQAAAVASLSQLDRIAERVETTHLGLAAVTESFQQLGFAPTESVANFICVSVGRDSREVYDQLLDEGVIVRPLGPFGMSDGLRITVGTPQENAIAAQAFFKVLGTVST